MRSVALTGLFVALGALAAPAARAQSSEDKAAAAAAFDQGLALMDGKQYAEACAQFERGQALDPQLGNQFHLALCYEALGKLASAFGEFDELSGTDTNKKRRAQAKAHAAKLKPRLTRLTLVVNAPLPDLVVARDGKDVTLLVGVTTPVDPGVYTFTASAPERQPWSQKVDLTAEGATITVEIPELPPVAAVDDDGPTDDGVVDDAPDDGARPAVRDERPAPPPKRSRGKARRLAGIVTTGVGAVAAGVGLVLGYQAMQLGDDARTLCNGHLDACNGDVGAAQAKVDDARGKATLSNVLVGVGAAAVAGGLIVWLTAPHGGGGERQARVVPVIGANGAGLALDGSF